jgi:hypothetical protein
MSVIDAPRLDSRQPAIHTRRFTWFHRKFDCGRSISSIKRSGGVLVWMTDIDRTCSVEYYTGRTLLFIA